MKRCSCKKLAKARFEYYADGKTGNKNENPNGFQFPPQPRHSAGALRKRKGRAEGEDEAERQETAKVTNTTDTLIKTLQSIVHPIKQCNNMNRYFMMFGYEEQVA